MRDISHADLIAEGLVEPVAWGGADERFWLDCDLASLAEHRLGDPTDPRGLDDTRRAHWRSHATEERETSLSARDRYQHEYWLLEDGQRVGTIALSTTTYGACDLRVSSLYVFPEHRGRGVGGRALTRLAAILGKQRAGFRLDTCWSWQRTVRFYLRAGLWIYMWKRDLTFCGAATLPRPRIEVGAAEATLSVLRGEEWVVLARARRQGEGVVFDPFDHALAKDPRVDAACYMADSTLALAIALEGWPLQASPGVWGKSYYADAGAAEALAYKIVMWEAWDRAHNWIVETPRIAGLTYATWAELEARWAAEEAAYAEGKEA